MNKIFSSPWGKVDHQSEHAEGIDFVSTSSHGGYHLSPERQAEFSNHCLGCSSFGPEWLEEDCDAILVYLVWPDLATDEQLAGAEDAAQAISTWEHSKARWMPVFEWLQWPGQEELRKRAQAHRDSVVHLWERGSMGSMTPEGIPSNHWNVSFSRRGSRRTIFMPYPTKRYYTSEELDAFPRPKPPEVKKHKSGFPQSCISGNSYAFEPSDADPGL